MKDKSRFISSVIVSLLAGFTYFQFGQGIEKNIQSSIKNVLSSNDMEQYLTDECMPLTNLIQTESGKLTKKKSKFYLKKRNTIEFKTKNSTIAGDELFSEFVAGKQAKLQRSAPDRNVDFTAELQRLVKNNGTNPAPKQSRGLKVFQSLSDNSKVADSREFNSGSSPINKGFEKRGVQYGNGFEYNIIIQTDSSPEAKTEKMSGYEYNGNFNNTYKNSYSYPDENSGNEKYRKNKKIRIVTPKVHVKILDSDIEGEPVEITVPEDSETEGTM